MARVTAIALPTTISNLIEEFERKDAALEHEITQFDAAWEALGMAATVQGTYAHSIGNKPYLSVPLLRKNLLMSGWQAVYNKLQIDRIASADDKRKFKAAMADPVALTFENAKATFGDYFLRPRFHILRAVAEVFTSLDPAYKSHSNVKIGVKGLPKRIILNGWGSFSGSYAHDRFRDMCNALATYQGKPHFEYAEMQAIDQAHRQNEDAILDGRSYFEPRRSGEPLELKTVDRGLTVRKFQNGNAHVFFEKWALLDINRALGEFYGDVLPDTPDETPKAGTAVAKDLQFYWTPPSVVDQALEFAGIYTVDNYRQGQAPTLAILEPSCGDGRILDGLAARGQKGFGIECDAGRAAQARASGHSVLTANFLEQPPQPKFDLVVMNPPFYGRHYVKHVNHALKFLKPGGILVAILPATARYDHKELKGDWRDLPVASFADSGTNVPTTMLKIVKREVQS